MQHRVAPIAVAVLVIAGCAGAAGGAGSVADARGSPQPDAGFFHSDGSNATPLDSGGADTRDPGDRDAGSTGTVPDGAADARLQIDAGIELDARAVSDATAKAIALGYYTGDQGSFNAVVAFTSYLQIISSDLFDVTSDGGVVGGDDFDGGGYSKANGIAAYACISNYSDTLGDFDPALGHSAMVTNEKTVIANAVALAKSSGYAGVNIDFESLAYSTNVADDRAAYSTFIHDLSTALHASGLKLIISVPAKTDDSATDTWDYPYDYAALGADVDYMQIMTYDENGPGWSGPGPVSGADWVENCVVYGTSVVPKDKLLIGLPAYGYEWDLTASNPDAGTYSGTSVSWTGFAALVATPGAVTHWDAPSSTPYVDYRSSDGHAHELWYENATSITTKTKLVPTYGIAGYSMWSLGQEDVTFWQAASAGAP